VIDQKYRLGRLLGEGGMGAVYEATDLRDGRVVALKLLTGTLVDPAARVRFEREARALFELRHESLVRVLDYSAAGSETYFVMELAPGLNLSELVQREGPLAPERVARIAIAITGALQAAHARGIIHRDVKPQNIQISPGLHGVETVRLLDFGLAKDLSAGGHALTQEGTVVGTMQYMAPEQAKGHSVDARADLYSLGACMYYALTGRRPFEGLSSLPLYRAVLTLAPRSLLDLRGDLPPLLVAIVERALVKDPTHRFTSADELGRTLGSYVSAVAAPSLTPSGQVRSPYWGNTVPLSAIPMLTAPGGADSLTPPVSSEAPTAPLAPPDTPIPDTTPSGPPDGSCPPTMRSGGKGPLLAGIFVLVGLLLAAGGSAMLVHAGGFMRVSARMPR
jgi:serine/threonine-protein kinase